ncbi:MAG: hypothetical protein Q7R45_09245, partial [Sulfuricaulis sp.]|nr:hypothetical protein [Sulfuricaulis sp.]
PTSKAANVFKALGIDIRQGPEAALRQFAEAMSLMKDGAAKTAVATELLGRAGIDMIPWLNQGAAGMDKASQSVRGLGLLISADFAAKAEQFNDNLKLLSMRSTALGISLGEHLVGGLSEFTGKLVEAAEKGNLLAGTLKELIKLDLALLSKLPGPLGALAGAAADFMFSESPAGNAFGGAVSGKIGGRPSGFGLPGAVNAEAVACAASGGTWVGGRCQRAGDAAKAEAELKRLLAEEHAAWEERERLLQGGIEGWAKYVDAMMEATNEQWRAVNAGESMTQLYERVGKTTLDNIDPSRAWARQLKDLTTLFDACYLSLQQYNAALEANDAAYTQLFKVTDIAKETEKATSFAREMGLTFTSAFENAAVSGKKLSEVLQGLAQDIARIIFRQSVTEPLGTAVTGLLKNLDFGSLFSDPTPTFFGGYAAHGGPVSSGGAYMVGERGPELFTPPSSGSIIPNDALGGGDSFQVNVTIQAVDARSVTQLFMEGGGERLMKGVIEKAYNKAGRRSGMSLA